MKKFFRSVTCVALATASAACLTLGITGCAGKTQSTERPTNVDITKVEAPTDGSLPTAHSAAENLSYIAYVLDAQPQYHCYTYTVTSASIATQYTKSYKDYKDGVTISSDITYSSMVKSGSQACFIEGANGPEAYMRFSSAPGADTTHLTADWSTEAPVHYNEQAYLYTYGLFQTEMTNYIINAETIADSGEVRQNSDGTYSQSVLLDPIASTYYYQFGMKTRGGLAGYPEFQSVSLDLTFDASWRILSIDIDEVSLVNKGVTVTSVSKSRVEYSYDDASFDSAHYAYYDNYFSQYVGDETLEEGGEFEEEMTVDLTNVLSNGFSKIMNGGQQFEITAELGQNKYVGYIFVSLDLSDPLGSLGLKLSLGRTFEEQGFYAEYADGEARAYYGEDFAAQVNIAAFKPVIEQFTQWADGLNEIFSQTEQSEDGALALSSDALTDLMNEMKLEVVGDSAKIVLRSDNLLGLGVGIDAQLHFGVGEKDITFHGATVSGIAFGGSGIDLALSLRTTTVPVIDREDTSASADLAEFAADIFNLLSADIIKVNLNLDGSSENVNISALKGIDVAASAYVDIDGVTVGAEVDVSYSRAEGALSAKLIAYYDYDTSSPDYGRIILKVVSINGVKTDIGVVCDISEVTEAVPALLELAGLETELFSSGSSATLNVADIINSLLASDLSGLIGELYADRAQIKASVSVDELLSALSIDAGVKFGYFNLTYTRGGANGGIMTAALPAMGLSLSVSGTDGQLTLPDTSGYLDLADLVNTVTNAWRNVNGIIAEGGINLDLPEGGTYISYGGTTLAADGAVSVNWKKGYVAADLNVKIASRATAVTRVQVVYNRYNSANKPMVRLAINGAAMDIYASDIQSALSQIGSVATTLSPAIEGGDEEQQLLALVFGMLSDGEWINVLNRMTLTTDGQSVTLSYLNNAAVKVTATEVGELGLDLSFRSGLFMGSASVSTSAQNIYDETYAVIGSYNPVSTANGDSFIKVVYDYLFDAFGAVDLTDVLGGAYNVTLSLNGNNSGIDQLKGVQVNAEIYLSEYRNKNILTADVWLNISNVEVKFDITVWGEEIYVSVTNITGKELPHLRIKTTSDSLYSLLSDLVDTAVNSGILGGTKAATLSESAAESGKAVATDLIFSLVNFDFGSAFLCTEVNGVKSVTIDVDDILSQLNVAAPSIGCITASISAADISASATNGGREWLSVSCGTKQKDYSSFRPDEYIDFSSVTALPIVDILNLFNSENLALSLGFENGGLKLDAEACINVTGLVASVSADIEYAYGDKLISATIAAYYDGEGGVYLHVTKLQGRDYSLSVFCNTDEISVAVTNLLAALQTEAAEGGIINLPDIDTSALITNALTADYAAIFSGIYANKGGIGVNIDGDKLLTELGLDLGIALGQIELRYVTGGSLTVSAPVTGLDLAVASSESAPSNPSYDCFDITQLIDTVTGIIEGKTFTVEASFDADKSTVSELESLAGLSADIKAYVQIGSAPKAQADLALSYTSDGKSVSAEICAYYELSSLDGYSYNNVYLSVNSINGKSTDIAVMCEVSELAEAVGQLMQAINVQSATLALPEISVDGAQIVGALLAADFGSLVKELSANSQGINLTIGLDELLGALGTDLGLQLGDMTFGYSSANVAQAALPALGVNVKVSCFADEHIFVLPEKDYLDLVDLVNTVNAVRAEIDKVISSQSLSFDIAEQTPAYITVDGITASVSGRGEVSWRAGATSVALDLIVAIAETGRDVLELKLVYSEDAPADEPIATIALNKVALEIYRSDLDGVTDKISSIITAVSPLLGTTGEASATLSATMPENTTYATTDEVIYAVLALLSDGGWVDVLNDFTLSADGHSVALSYLSDGAAGISISAEDGLVLSWNAAKEGDGASFETGARLAISSSSGTLAEEISKAVHTDAYKLTTSDGQGGTSFIRLVYDYLFEALRSVSFDNILGSNVYNISFVLDGANTDIAELSGIYVDAQAYVKNSNGGIVMQSDFDFDINGVVVNAQLIMENTAGETRFYITLTQVGDVVLNGLKVYVSQSTLYDTVEALVSVVCDTDILTKVLAMLSPATTVQQVSAVALEESAKTSVTDIIYNLLSADLSKAFVAVTDGGITNASIDIDTLLGALGTDLGYSLGSIDCQINHKTHAMTTSANVQGMAASWLSLTSRRLSESEIASLDYALASVDKTDYIDLAFLPSLVGDLKSSVTDDSGAMYEHMTFKGSIDVNVVSMLNITISDLIMTVNAGADNFYLALEGYLSGSMVSSRRIGLTYQNGYLTLYRDVNGGEYRVMTFEYFLDNMFASGDTSTLNWLLGANSTIWGLVGSFVPEVSSGLTTPGDVYLYEHEEQSAASEVSLSDYIIAAHAMIGGSEELLFQSSEGGVNALINELGLSGDNYYAFDINASVLTDGVLTKLSAAITRAADGSGITGLKANGAISSYVSFKLNLSYTENDPAPCSSHFSAVSEGFASFAQNGEITDGASGIFGCYNSADNSVKFSYLLTPYTLTIVDTDGSRTEMTVREGFTVYLYDNYFPAYTDESKQFRKLYSLTENGEPVTSFVMNGDTTVYVVKRRAVEISVSNSGSAPDFVYSTFVGDTLPAHFDGFATLEDFRFADGTLSAGTVVSENTPSAIYGNYELASCTIDYINYEFNADDGSYHVTGLAAGYIQYYVNGNRTIVIADSINGVNVTAIDAGAFANTNTDGNGNIDATKSIKDVVVPATVTEVGESAFANNVGMQSIIFLADSVHLSGSGNNDGSTYPFYGCSTYATSDYVGSNKGNEITSLNIYYNNITAKDGNWNIFRYVYNGWWYRFYVGDNGGSLNGAGSWIYADVTVENDTEFNIEDEAKAFVADGLNKSVDLSYVQSSLQTIADRYTASQYGEIGKYIVSVNAQKGADGKTYVTVSLNSSSDVWYSLSVNRGAAGNVTLSGDVRQFDGATYARGEVTFTAESVMTGYKFVSFSDGKSEITSNPATFAISGVTEVVANFYANISNVNVVSALDFNYAGTQYGASAEGVSVSVALNENGELLPVAPTVAGYEFLGWASVADGQMSFTTMSDTNVTYYAIWGGAKEGITYTLQTSGTAVNTPAVSAGSFENWYSSADYATVISSALSADNTVFHARRQYSLSYGISGAGTQYQNTATMSKSAYALSKKITCTVLEGKSVTFERTNNYHDIIIYIDGAEYTTLKLISFNVIFTNIHYTFKDDYFVNGDTFTIVPADNMEYIFNY